MSIRLSMLAILTQGECYGYQLRLEYERRTGAVRSLNVGQVYATLDRLERDGFAAKTETDIAGHVYYAITDLGRLEVDAWIASAVGGSSLEELATKLALISTLPGVDARALVAAQREAIASTIAPTDADADPARRLVLSALTAAAGAQLQWLDGIEPILTRVAPYGLAAEPPRRGRPARA
jgi:DNA-binding PadR family transcriptional regulator